MRLSMKYRWILTLLAAGSPVAAFAAAPEETTEFVLDVWYSRGHARQIRMHQEARDRMDVELRNANDRICVKERLIADLIAERQSFGEVVRQFVELNAVGKTEYPGIPLDDAASAEEKAAFSVLCYVSQRGTPEGSALPRLAAEYEARFDRVFPLK